MTKTDNEIANEHAEWYSSHFAEIIKKVYHDAFLHGMKHEKEKEKQR